MNDIVESPFGASRGTALAESAGAQQMQSREVAELQTQYLMAQRFPRDEVAATDRIINSFQRASLAEVAQYQFARGGTDITGPSIHAMQAIATHWGNLEFGWREVSRGIGADGVPFSEVQGYAVDLQNRVRRPLQFIVRHWRDTKSGGYKLKDERDIYELCANMAQRRVRSCILAIVPPDVVDAAMEQASMTLNAKADTSPEAMKKMLTAFEAFSVTKEQIEKRIQRRVDSITAAQVVALKRIYASMRDGMSGAGEWFEGHEQPEPRDAGAARVAEALKSAPGAKAPPAAKKAPAADPEPGAEQPPVDVSSAPAWDLKRYTGAIEKAKDRDTAAVILDEARTALAEDEHATLTATYRLKFAD